VPKALIQLIVDNGLHIADLVIVAEVACESKAPTDRLADFVVRRLVLAERHKRSPTCLRVQHPESSKHSQIALPQVPYWPLVEQRSIDHLLPPSKCNGGRLPEPCCVDIRGQRQRCTASVPEPARERGFDRFRIRVGAE